jgi:hypothetical protein
MRSRSSAPSAPITSAPKAWAHGREGGAAGQGERARDGIGVDQRGAAFDEHARHGALAAADAAGQPDRAGLSR